MKTTKSAEALLVARILSYKEGGPVSRPAPDTNKRATPPRHCRSGPRDLSLVWRIRGASCSSFRWLRRCVIHHLREWSCILSVIPVRRKSPSLSKQCLQPGDRQILRIPDIRIARGPTTVRHNCRFRSSPAILRLLSRSRIPDEERRPAGRLSSTPPVTDRCCYLVILETTPAPTVRPPSRIAKRRPSSMATGLIRVTAIFTLSPGITISTPSGSSQAPVMSVVRK